MEQQEFHIQESMSPAELELKYRQAYEKAMAENVALKDENARLKEQLAWFQKAVYGQKSERTEVVLEAPDQLKLFDEAEAAADRQVLAGGSVEVAAHKRKAKRTHEELAENLPVEEVLTTMANWMIYAASAFGKPVWEQMKAELLESSVIHADETVVQVLNEPGKKAKTDSRMWVYCNGKLGERSNILFEYQPTRNGDHAVRFLGDYRGYLMCDGYDGYNKLKNAVRCGCFAHVRRKFVDALPSNPELLSTSQAAKGIEYCNRIYGLERQFAGYPPEERKEKRQAELKPLLEEFFAWAESVQTAGGSKLARAIGYLTSEKKYLVRFLESPDVPIDNNRAENAIRPFCVGRKNWLFSASVKGAKASAVLYSLAATACANGFNVEEYFTRLFQSRPGTLLMPW